MELIQLVNHSSVIISDGENSLLTDPYLSGSCFNNGWDLIVETKSKIEDLNFDYIWISHEHPDHFSPRDLLKIPIKKRGFITILYQKTKDKKVYDYCIAKGFNVIELSDYEEFKINDNFSITACQHRDSDCWSLFKIGSKKILNLNDCWIYDKSELKMFNDIYGKIDVLLTQFSFANWIGNVGDHKKSNKISKWHLEKLILQNEIINPRYIIPFASFVYFSNEENSYLNNYSIKIRDVFNVTKSSNVNPIILFPDDAWIVGEPFDNEKRVKMWDIAYKNVSKKELRLIKKRNIRDLENIFHKYQKRLFKKNSYNDLIKLKKNNLLPTTYIDITDLDIKVSMDIINGIEVVNENSIDKMDIHMSSDSLYYLLENEWGRGTLQINGRFQAGNGKLINFIRQTQIAFANNINRFYPKDFSLSEFQEPRNYVLSVHNEKIDSHT